MPDFPSSEMLYDWIQDAYDLESEPTKAAALWMRVWTVMRQRMTPDIRTCPEADFLPSVNANPTQQDPKTPPDQREQG